MPGHDVPSCPEILARGGRYTLSRSANGDLLLWSQADFYTARLTGAEASHLSDRLDATASHSGATTDDVLGRFWTTRGLNWLATQEGA